MPTVTEQDANLALLFVEICILIEFMMPPHILVYLYIFSIAFLFFCFFFCFNGDSQSPVL